MYVFGMEGWCIWEGREEALVVDRVKTMTELASILDEAVHR
jgi:hypothetical protein